jgi:hypothetical protein
MNGPDAFSIVAQAQLAAQRQQQQQARRPIPAGSPVDLASGEGATGAHSTWTTRLRAVLAAATLRAGSSRP